MAKNVKRLEQDRVRTVEYHCCFSGKGVGEDVIWSMGMNERFLLLWTEAVSVNV